MQTSFINLLIGLQTDKRLPLIELTFAFCAQVSTLYLLVLVQVCEAVASI
jgi:hypothetical protein